MIRSSLLFAALSLALVWFAPVALAVDRPPILRLNQYYVLYSRPISPLMGGDGDTVLVPLRIFADLLGLRATFFNRGRSAVAQRAQMLPRPDSPAVGFKAGVRRATVNGRQVLLPVAPRWLEHEFDMLVPLQTLAQAVGFAVQWDPRLGILALQDPSILKVPTVEQMDELLVHTVPTWDTEEVVPVRFSLRRFEEDGILNYRLEVVLERKNSSRSLQSKPTLYTVAVYQAGYMAVGGWNIMLPSPDIGPIPDPCKRETGGARCVSVFQVGSSPLQYVLGRVRVFP